MSTDPRAGWFASVSDEQRAAWIATAEEIKAHIDRIAGYIAEMQATLDRTLVNGAGPPARPTRRAPSRRSKK